MSGLKISYMMDCLKPKLPAEKYYFQTKKTRETLLFFLSFESIPVNVQLKHVMQN